MGNNKKGGVLTLVPVGGIANRMRAMASAFHLCAAVGSELRVIWFRDKALNARFRDIFEPVAVGCMSVREATAADYVISDRPRRHNLWLPALPQMLLYRRRIYERSVTPLKQRGFDFAAWAAGKRCYMGCYQEFGSYPDELLGRLFCPALSVRERVESNVRLFSAHTIGMHIRRTDNGEATAKSPTALFVEAGKKEIAAHPDLKIYLATDDESVKEELRAVFGARIITPAEVAARDSADGIRGGLADMYTLARTARIYGSAGSSFSPMAARIGRVPFICVSTDAGER